jgi:enoyl-CoA hydratase/carnithine racemase
MVIRPSEGYEMDVLTRSSDGILTIEINRPEKKNAITAAMYQAMADAIVAADNDPAVRVILIHGQPDVFTAGNDLEDFLKRPPADETSPVYQFMHALSRATKPVVAAVTGVAVGIGTTMLLHCDLVYVGDNAKFIAPFTSLGLVPEFASSLLLPMAAGYQRAAELLLLGETLDAAKAKDVGFVTQVLPAAETLPAAQAAAIKLTRLPGKSVRVTKELLKRSRARLIDEQIKTEAAHFAAMLNEPAAKEAFSAFLGKRKPDFSKMA